MNFRKAVKTDLPRIVEIYNQIIPSRLATADTIPISVESRKAWFNDFDDNHPLWVMENDNQLVIGWVGLEHFYGRPAYYNTAEISIYIDEKYRHQKLGSQALNFILDQIHYLQITAIVAYIFSHNTPSLKLFKKFGFETWGHLPNVAKMDGQLYSLDILGRRFD